MTINWDKVYKGFTALALAIVLILAGLGLYQQDGAAADASVARGGFSTTVHFEQGGGQLTVESGGKVQVNSGGTLALASGSTLTLASSSVITTSIADITRTVNLPLRSWIECTTDAGADINYSSGADAFPDFINSATDGLGFTLDFDATGGSVDTASVCNQLQVPSDYASGGAIIVRATKGAETGANSEVINCKGSINGAALGTGGTITTTGTTSAVYVCTPTLTNLAAQNSLGIDLYITSGGTADDTVSMQSIAFEYTAVE
jgi:hypothetical protein